MRILVTDPGWLDASEELNKRGITLEIRPRAKYEKGIDGLLVPAEGLDWPLTPSRYHYAQVVVYGPPDEVAKFRDEPAVKVLEVSTLLTPTLAAEAVKEAFKPKFVLPFVHLSSARDQRAHGQGTQHVGLPQGQGEVVGGVLG